MTDQTKAEFETTLCDELTARLPGGVAVERIEVFDHGTQVCAHLVKGGRRIADRVSVDGTDLIGRLLAKLTPVFA